MTRPYTRRTCLKTMALGALTPLSALGAPSQARTQTLLTKAIPSTGEHIPIVGIGTNRYGVGNDTAAMAPLAQVLKAFAQAGGGLIDTAPMYGSSETVLGQLIANAGLRDAFFMATKCDVNGGQSTRDQLASSAAKLASGKLDLVAVHNIKHWRQQLPVLQAAKAAGDIRYVGITTSRDQQYSEFRDILANEPLDFMQINYSLGDRDAEPLLELAHDRGVAVMVNLAFGRGRLFRAVKGQALPDWAHDFDANSWAQFFLKYVVAHPAVTCVIPGTTKLTHLHDNLGGARGRLPNAQQRQQMERFYDAL